MTDLRSLPTFIKTGLDAAKGTPQFIGQTYYASDVSKLYIATGTSSPADWTQFTGGSSASLRRAKVEGWFDDGGLVGIGDTYTPQWTTELYDTGTFWSTANRTRFIIPANGAYEIGFYCSIVRPASSYMEITCRFRKNGSTLFGPLDSITYLNSDAQARFNMRLYDQAEFVAGDYVEVYMTSATSPVANMVNAGLTGFFIKEL